MQRPRRLHAFRDISDLVFTGAATLQEQARWFDENGPIVPGLIDHLTSGVPAYDRVLFWSYRYYPAFHGVQAVRDRAVLVPTAEEDPLIHAPILASYFAWPRAYLFLTPEERDLVTSRIAGAAPPSAVIGAGLDAPGASQGREVLDALGIPETFLLYMGRIERNKGCETLLRYFAAYLADGRPPIPLVMAGPAIMPIPEHPLIRPLGYVPDAVRDALLAHARALVVPSPYESLSMVLLEAWNRGTASAGERALPCAQGAGGTGRRRAVLRHRARVRRGGRTTRARAGSGPHAGGTGARLRGQRVPLAGGHAADRVVACRQLTRSMSPGQLAVVGGRLQR